MKQYKTLSNLKHNTIEYTEGSIVEMKVKTAKPLVRDGVLLSSKKTKKAIKNEEKKDKEKPEKTKKKTKEEKKKGFLGFGG